jgi:hypothetical protein
VKSFVLLSLLRKDSVVLGLRWSVGVVFRLVLFDAVEFGEVAAVAASAAAVVVDIGMVIVVDVVVVIVVDAVVVVVSVNFFVKDGPLWEKIFDYHIWKEANEMAMKDPH